MTTGQMPPTHLTAVERRIGPFATLGIIAVVLGAARLAEGHDAPILTAGLGAVLAFFGMAAVAAERPLRDHSEWLGGLVFLGILGLLMWWWGRDGRGATFVCCCLYVGGAVGYLARRLARLGQNHDSRFQLFDAQLTCGSDVDVLARGHLEGQTVLVVHAGSTALGNKLTNERMLEWGVVERSGKRFKFLLNFTFQSPADAACFILGFRPPAGIDCWKDSSGQTLRQLYIANGWGWLVDDQRATTVTPPPSRPK